LFFYEFHYLSVPTSIDSVRGKTVLRRNCQMSRKLRRAIRYRSGAKLHYSSVSLIRVVSENNLHSSSESFTISNIPTEQIISHNNTTTNRLLWRLHLLQWWWHRGRQEEL